MAKPLFTIAISGCSSAGKSTLAFLLSEIFSDIEVDVSGKSGLSWSLPARFCYLLGCGCADQVLDIQNIDLLPFCLGCGLHLHCSEL
jgi:hypothetical protein